MRTNKNHDAPLILSLYNAAMYVVPHAFHPFSYSPRSRQPTAQIIHRLAPLGETSSELSPHKGYSSRHLFVLHFKQEYIEFGVARNNENPRVPQKIAEKQNQKRCDRRPRETTAQKNVLPELILRIQTETPSRKQTILARCTGIFPGKRMRTLVPVCTPYLRTKQIPRTWIDFDCIREKKISIFVPQLQERSTSDP